MTDQKQQRVAVSDTGRVAAQVLSDPAQYMGQTIELAGDDLTLSEVQDALGRVTGSRPWKIWLPRAFLELIVGHEFRSMARVSHGMIMLYYQDRC